MQFEKQYCKNHPESEANWKCLGCGDSFCEVCVRVYSVSLQGKTASCFVCKDRCIDFKLEAEEQQYLLEQKASEKKQNLIRYTGFFLLCLPFLFEAINQFESSFILTDLNFILILMGASWFGPLRNIDFEIKARAGSVALLFFLITLFLGIGPSFIKYSTIIFMMLFIPLSVDIIAKLFLKVLKY